MGATAALSLASTIDNGDFERHSASACFSYGSGCCSEFFSGVVTKEGQQRLRAHEASRSGSTGATSCRWTQYDRAAGRTAAS